MAVGGSDNAWWLDVLRHGPASRYARYFDIDWNPADPALRGKVLAPFLGQPYGEALQAGDLQLAADAAGAPVIRYFDDRYPIAPRDQAEIAAARPRPPTTRPPRTAAPACTGCWSGRTIASPGGAPRATRSTGAASSTSTAWPRLRIEDPEVFEATHATLFRLYAEGLIDGVRVDHVDGLTDPARLLPPPARPAGGAAAERPPSAPAAGLTSWWRRSSAPARPADRLGLDGTSGYDFMDQVSAVQHDQAAERPLAFFWSAVSGRPADFATEEAWPGARSWSAASSAARGDRHALHRLARLDPLTRDTTRRRSAAPCSRCWRISRSIAPTTPGARARPASRRPSPAHWRRPRPTRRSRCIRCWTGSTAGWAARTPANPARALRQAAPRGASSSSARRSPPRRSRTPPSIATAGCCRATTSGSTRRALAPNRPNSTPPTRRARGSFPDAMLATATHDHKRGEDVRARLAVLSAKSPTNGRRRCSAGWRRTRRIAGRGGPVAGDEAMLYQMIVGAWPTDPVGRRCRGLQGIRRAAGGLAAEGHARGQAARRLDRAGRSL